MLESTIPPRDQVLVDSLTFHLDGPASVLSALLTALHGLVYRRVGVENPWSFMVLPPWTPLECAWLFVKKIGIGMGKGF